MSLKLVVISDLNCEMTFEHAFILDSIREMTFEFAEMVNWNIEMNNATTDMINGNIEINVVSLRKQNSDRTCGLCQVTRAARPFRVA